MFTHLKTLAYRGSLLSNRQPRLQSVSFPKFFSTASNDIGSSPLPPKPPTSSPCSQVTLPLLDADAFYQQFLSSQKPLEILSMKELANIQPLDRHVVLMYTTRQCILCDEAKIFIQRAKHLYPNKFHYAEVNVFHPDYCTPLGQFKTEIPVVFINGKEFSRHRMDGDAFIDAIKLLPEHPTSDQIAASIQAIPKRVPLPKPSP